MLNQTLPTKSHTQSIYYRLEQLQGMLGDLDTFERRTGILIAIKLLEYLEQTEDRF
jgi:hypothetical protein